MHNNNPIIRRFPALREQMGDPRSHYGWGSLGMMIIFAICIFSA